ncbi:MAG: amidohydrolase family protein [Armatimonadetes bacterium]|nr:amidohydrolase family protein [Armatimonadota bacterium]
MSPVVDIHVHPTLGQPTEDACDALVAAARRARVDRLVLLGTVGEMGFYPTPEQVRQANDVTLSWIRHRPLECLGYCYLSPRHDPGFCRDELARCLALGMCGVKLWIALKASDPRLDDTMALAADTCLPVLQHAWYKTVQGYPDESSPADVAELARRWPQVSIVMAHLTGGGRRGVADVADYPNVYADTSGGPPVAGLVEYAVRELGEERVLFGSDAPGRDFSVAVARVEGSRLTERQKRRVLGVNACRLMGLPAEEPA